MMNLRYSGQRIASALKRKAIWFEQYEERIVTAFPAMRGKVEWDTATYFYNEGLSADEAATRYIANRTEPRTPR